MGLLKNMCKNLFLKIGYFYLKLVKLSTLINVLKAWCYLLYIAM